MPSYWLPMRRGKPNIGIGLWEEITGGKPCNDSLEEVLMGCIHCRERWWIYMQK